MTFSKKPCIFYGEMHQLDASTIVTINTIAVFEIVDGMSVGLLKKFEFQNSQELKCKKKGRYQVFHAICIEGGNNLEWQSSLFINGVEQENTTTCSTTGANKNMNMASGGFIDLEVDDIITLKIANLTNTTNGEIMAANVNLIRIDC